MFPFINITPSLSASKLEVLTRLFPSLPSDFASRLIALEEAIAGCDVSSSVALSLRQLIRLCRRVAAYPEELTGSALHSLIARQCMSVFLPKPERDTIDRLIETSLGARPSTSSTEQELRIETNERSGRKYVRIGVTEAPVAQAAHPALVPRVLFYDIPRHIAALEQLLRDFMLGEHLLLIGNQGVGKNKLVDRLLELLNREREYMQLHRDTTVQSLTVLPALEAGRIVWRDSPLVRAAMHGRVLVLDEADKAPLEVVAVLKGLVEDSEMLV